jgi:hypothetical protein
MNLATFKKAVAQFEPIAYTGVILNDFSREGSRAYRTIGAPSYISASRSIPFDFAQGRLFASSG